MELQPEVGYDALGIVDVDFRGLGVRSLYMADQDRKLVRNKGIIDLKGSREKPLAGKAVSPRGCRHKHKKHRHKTQERGPLRKKSPHHD